VAQQLFAEALILVTFGAAAGLLIDVFLRDRLSYVHWSSAYNLPFEFHFQTDRGLFLYAAAAVIAAILLSSLLPSLSGSNADLGLAMKQGEPAFSIRRWDLRNSFVTLQVVMSVVLLVLGALFGRAFVQLAGADPGFDISHTVMTTVWLPSGAHLARDQRLVWRDSLVRRLKDTPGVVGVTSIGTLPFMGELQQQPVRRKSDPAGTGRNAYAMGAGEQFCHVLGIPILRGRDFEITDRTRVPVPALVNRALARRLFGDADPIGVQVVAGQGQEHVLEIVGLVGDTRMRTLGEEHAPMFFTPYDDAQLMVRTAGHAGRWVTPIQGVLSRTEPASAQDVRPLSDAAAGAIFPMRVAAGFIGSMSVVGLLLALSGFYSSVSYSTKRRTREMAIRIAVGATQSAIQWTAIRDGVAILACGILAGIALATAAIRLLTNLLPDGLEPWNPAMFAGVGLILLATGVAAAWVAVRGVSKVDPAIVLKGD
jgi:putative ABC transport system permease protein